MVAVFHPKTPQNIGTLWRTAQQCGAAALITVGTRYTRERTDTYQATKHLPLYHVRTFEKLLMWQPVDACLVDIEIGGKPLSTFTHPARAVYLLGAEDHGLPPSVLDRCQQVVSLEAVAQPSYNVAEAGSLVLYHRCFLAKQGDRHAISDHQ